MKCHMGPSILGYPWSHFELNDFEMYIVWHELKPQRRVELRRKKEKKKEKKNPSIPLASLENRVLKEYEKKWMQENKHKI